MRDNEQEFQFKIVRDSKHYIAQASELELRVIALCIAIAAGTISELRNKLSKEELILQQIYCMRLQNLISVEGAIHIQSTIYKAIEYTEKNA